jgi:rod shape-determining protein MreC
VHDKTVRRRRAVLGLLVVLSLLLLTAYFGEAPNGRLHAVQRDFLTVVSPIQDGANKALKPVRDMFGWIDNTLHAKSQRDQLLKQVDKLRRELVANEAEKRSYGELLSLYHLDSGLKVSDYRPVNATVVAKSPNVWYSTVTIDEGESAGVRVNDPVINGEGLVGKVAQTASASSQTARWGFPRGSEWVTRSGSCSPRWGTPTICCCSTCPPTPPPIRVNTSSHPGPSQAPMTRSTRPVSPSGR